MRGMSPHTFGQKIYFAFRNSQIDPYFDSLGFFRTLHAFVEEKPAFDANKSGETKSTVIRPALVLHVSAFLHPPREKGRSD